MAITGQTVFRFCGALLLATGATAMDRPRELNTVVPQRAAVAPRERPATGSLPRRMEVGITPRKRAFGIRVNDVGTLAGMIQPNSRVDLMVVIDDPNTRGRRTAKLFMSNIRVHSIGTVPERDADGRAVSAVVATIEVTPEEAEHLAFATTQGQIQLVLRGYGDPGGIDTKGASTNDIVREARGSR